MHRLNVALVSRLQGDLSDRYCSSKTTAEVLVCWFAYPVSYLRQSASKSVEENICQDEVKPVLKEDHTVTHSPPYEKPLSLLQEPAVA